MPTPGQCADFRRPRNSVSAPSGDPSDAIATKLAAQIHAAANGGPSRSASRKTCSTRTSPSSLSRSQSFDAPNANPRRIAGSEADNSASRGRLLAGVSPGSPSQRVASHRRFVNAGLVEAERRPRMRTARELYHLKDRAGSSSGYVRSSHNSRPRSQLLNRPNASDNGMNLWSGTGRLGT